MALNQFCAEGELKGISKADQIKILENSTQKLVDILISTNRLCERLHINPKLPEKIKWAQIGYALAAEQSEFKNKRGRPRKKNSDSEKLAYMVTSYQDELEYDSPGVQRLTDIQYIKTMKKFIKMHGKTIKSNKFDEFKHLLQASEDTLRKKISEGRKKLREK